MADRQDSPNFLPLSTQGDTMKSKRLRNWAYPKYNGWDITKGEIIKRKKAQRHVVKATLKHSLVS